MEGTHKGPAIWNVRKTWKAPKLTEQILNGGKKMPPFRESLSDVEAAELVAWLRAKHEEPPPPPAKPVTPSVPVPSPDE